MKQTHSLSYLYALLGCISIGSILLPFIIEQVIPFLKEYITIELTEYHAYLVAIFVSLLSVCVGYSKYLTTDNRFIASLMGQLSFPLLVANFMTKYYINEYTYIIPISILLSLFWGSQAILHKSSILIFLSVVSAHNSIYLLRECEGMFCSDNYRHQLDNVYYHRMTSFMLSTFCVIIIRSNALRFVCNNPNEYIDLLKPSCLLMIFFNHFFSMVVLDEHRFDSQNFNLKQYAFDLCVTFIPVIYSRSIEKDVKINWVELLMSFGYIFYVMYRIIPYNSNTINMLMGVSLLCIAFVMNAVDRTNDKNTKTQ